MSQGLTRLEAGLITHGSMGDQILQEMLDHQGINYEIVNELSEARLPITVSMDSSNESVSLAKKICGNEKNLIDVSKVIELDKIANCLTGRKDDRTDRFGMIVNEAELRLREAIRNTFLSAGLPFVAKWFWPNNAKACCVLTHDIDWFTYSPFHRAVMDGNIGIIKLLKLAAQSVFRGKDYGWNILETIDLERKYNLTSSFYFQTDYDGHEDLLKRSLDGLKSAKFEIGLHASHNSHRDANSLKTELTSFKQMVGSLPEGIRYHILRFDTPKTWLLEIDQNMKYDATFSFNEFFGFRAELCFPYHPFDGTRRLVEITELPTGFMDWTALHRKQRGKLALANMDKVAGVVERYNGALIVNFHNTYLNGDTFPDIYDLYKNLLSRVSNGKYWVATASECANWWNYRCSRRVHPTIDGLGKIHVQDESVPLVTESENGIVRPIEAWF